MEIFRLGRPRLPNIGMTPGLEGEMLDYPPNLLEALRLRPDILTSDNLYALGMPNGKTKVTIRIIEQQDVVNTVKDWQKTYDGTRWQSYAPDSRGGLEMPFVVIPFEQTFTIPITYETERNIITNLIPIDPEEGSPTRYSPEKVQFDAINLLMSDLRNGNQRS